MTIPCSTGLCKTIKSHGHRFRKFSIDVDHAFVHLWESLQEMLRDLTAPELVQILLQGTGRYSRLIERSSMFRASGTPLLRDARLGHFGMRFFRIPGSIPTLHLDAKKARLSDSPNEPGNISLREFLEMMTMCPFLEKLEIHGDTAPLGPGGPQ